MGVAGRTGVSVSSVDTAQDLVDVFSEQYRELDSARMLVMERQKRYLSVSPEAVSDTHGQFKLLSKLDLRGGLIDTKCERNFS